MDRTLFALVECFVVIPCTRAAKDLVLPGILVGLGQGTGSGCWAGAIEGESLGGIQDGGGVHDDASTREGGGSGRGLGQDEDALGDLVGNDK